MRCARWCACSGGTTPPSGLPAPGSPTSGDSSSREPVAHWSTSQLSGDVDEVPPTVAAAVYRLAQEGVTNARRHARNATRVDVRVHADKAGIRLDVRDDGDPAASAAPGYGITGMIERATLLGGTCEAGAAAGGGWAVTAVLPRSAWST